MGMVYYLLLDFKATKKKLTRAPSKKGKTLFTLYAKDFHLPKNSLTSMLCVCATILWPRECRSHSIQSEHCLIIFFHNVWQKQLFQRKRSNQSYWKKVRHAPLYIKFQTNLFNSNYIHYLYIIPKFLLTVREAASRNVSLVKEKVKIVPMKKGNFLLFNCSNGFRFWSRQKQWFYYLLMFFLFFPRRQT